MNSGFLTYALGLLILIVIYGVAKWILNGRRPVTYHLVERIFVFGLGSVLVLIAIFSN